MISLPTPYDFRHSVGAILSVMPVLRKREYLEIQRQEQTVYKAVMEGISLG
jgi:hypothetical protein